MGHIGKELVGLLQQLPIVDPDGWDSAEDLHRGQKNVMLARAMRVAPGGRHHFSMIGPPCLLVPLYQYRVGRDGEGVYHRRLQAPLDLHLLKHSTSHCELKVGRGHRVPGSSLPLRFFSAGSTTDALGAAMARQGKALGMVKGW